MLVDESRATIHQLQARPALVGRNDALVALASGRRVTHVGCTDAPFTEQMVANGTLLHPQLLSAATECIGVDIDADGVQELKALVGGDYVVGDLLDPVVSGELVDFAPDAIIVADVIEHVPDAVGFLRGLAGILRAAAPSPVVLCVTTPNGLALRPTTQTAFGFEVMHPDHVALYTPTILRTVAAYAGLRVLSLDFYNNRHHSGVTHGRREALLTSASDTLVGVATAVRRQFADGMIATLAPAAVSAATR